MDTILWIGLLSFFVSEGLFITAGQSWLTWKMKTPKNAENGVISYNAVA